MKPSDKAAKPTNAEMEVLQVLWAKGPCTVRDVFEELSKGRSIVYTTALKLMQNMTDKGLLLREEQGRAHLYRPIESTQTAKRALVREMIEKVFGGSAQELVLHALSTDVPKDEISEIREMLDALEAKS